MESSTFHLVCLSGGQSIPILNTTRTVINNVTRTIKHAWVTVLHHTDPDDFPLLICTMIDHSGTAAFTEKLKTFPLRTPLYKLIKTKALNKDVPLECRGFLSMTLHVRSFFFLCRGSSVWVGRIKAATQLLLSPFIYLFFSCCFLLCQG